jgi:hypothetical protein
VASFEYSECVVQTVSTPVRSWESVTVCNGPTYQCLGARCAEDDPFIASYAAVYTYMVVALISPLAITLLLRLRKAVFPPLSFVICVAIMICALIGKLPCAAEERSLLPRFFDWSEVWS